MKTSRTDSEGRQLLDRLRQLERQAQPLEPGRKERGRLRRAVVAAGERYLNGLADQPGYVEAEAVPGTEGLGAPIGESGWPLEAALDLVEREVIRPGSHASSGRHLAYIPGSGLYPAALGDYLAAATNKFSGLAFSGPGPVRMEAELIRWAARLVGYPEGAGGHLASGGSLATLSALATAREAHGLRSAGFASAVVYRTGQAHHCLEKALHLIGLGEAVQREVPVDAGFRMDPAALAALITEDRASGLHPWLVVASAGTTDTGAVDPLEAIAEVAERAGCWFHVDAAYGGFFLLTGEGREKLRGIERSDSTVLDPHKGLFLPYGTGLLLVRDVRALAAAHSATGAYLQDAVREGGEEPSPADLSPELTRPFRALRLWLPLVLLGTAPFSAALEEKLLLARYFHREARAAGFETGPLPDLSIVTFRLAPEGLDLATANRLNQELVDRVRHDGRVFLSSTLIDDRFTLRLAVLSCRTHRSTVDLALRILREQAAALLPTSATKRWPT